MTLLNEYLAFNYGGPSVNCLFDGPKNGFDFPKALADICMKHYVPLVCDNDNGLFNAKNWSVVLSEKASIISWLASSFIKLRSNQHFALLVIEIKHS